MELDLAGKGVVVTGASKGIGKAIALAFAKEGANLSICARSEADLRTAQEELREFDIEAYAEACDVSDKKALHTYLENSRVALGRIDVLVNNASRQVLGDDDAAWMANFEVDVMAAARAIKIITPWMRDGGGGSMVNISSLAALFAYSSPAYGATKAAMISLSKSYALALAKDGIRVNVVAPGSTEVVGGYWDKTKRESPEVYDSTANSIPSGRLGKANEIADVVVFLASARAGWVTGACLTVDGGQLMAIR
jgi:3-oxoacyl-[acyl-carrier protein] reductase